MVNIGAGKNSGSYVEDGFDPSSWIEVEAYTEELLNRKISCSKCFDFEENVENVENVQNVLKMLKMSKIC